MEKSSLSFNADLVSVYKLFKDNAYRIPAYQRDYSWENEQWDQLWTDLANFKQDGSEEHFLGPVIVTPSEEEGDTYEVVDGQQRMTTLQILIAIIRDCWIQMGDKSISKSGVQVPNKRMTSDLIFSLTPQVRYNFTPNRNLKQIFNHFIQIPFGDAERKYFENKETFNSYPYSDRANEILRAYKYFHPKIIALGEEELRKFEAYLLHKVRLLVVEAGGSSNAYLLFETLNYRGLELTQTDLVKSYLFSKIIIDDADDRFVNEWDRVVDNIGQKSPDLFLRHYLLLYSKKVMKRDIYGEIKEKYKTREDATKFVGELEKFSRLYSFIVRESDFSGSKNNVLNTLFDDLALLNVDTQNIYLLAVLYKYYSESEDANLDKVENAARLSETLSFRWITCGRNAQDLENIYQAAAAMIMDELTPEDNFEEAQSLILSNLPSDSEFKTAIENSIIKSSKRAHYILRKIDEWQNGDGSYVLMDPVRLHLEHIAPQRPSGNYDWKSQMKGTLSYRDVIYRVGNLMLLRDKINREVSNQPFEKKLVKYKKNQNKLPTLSKEILNYSEWNQDTVLKRSEAIANLAIQVWGAEATNLKGKSKPQRKKKKKVLKKVDKS